jgi:beta-aspartyl-peptidase (threonine type)
MKILFSTCRGSAQAIILLTLLIWSCNPQTEEAGVAEQVQQKQVREFAIVIHGGAGVRDRAEFEADPQLEMAYREVLEQSLREGYQVLQSGGTSVEAIEAAITVMEDSPLFNAGKGASVTKEGEVEMDASIMDGNTHRAGALGAVREVKNPIQLARKVMEETPHVLLVDRGALAFAREMGVELMPRDYFITDRKWNEYLQRKEQNTPYGESISNDTTVGENRSIDPQAVDKQLFGTVGAVALDRHGNLAAATSTGGRIMKRQGRVGDSPIIGASTFADNSSCATSTTGLGEIHMTVLTGREIAARMEFKGTPIQEAADLTMQKVAERGGGGGVIAIDSNGNIAMSYLGDGMYRGFMDDSAKMEILIHDQ